MSMSRNVLFFLDSTGLMDRDMAIGFKKAGVNLYIEILNRGKTQDGHTVEFFSSERMINILETFKPDIIFSFNGNGLDNDGFLSNQYAIRGIPFVTWFVDMPRRFDIGNKYVKPDTYTFTFDRGYLSTLKGLGFSKYSLLFNMISFSINSM